jgi:hypothetical protein
MIGNASEEGLMQQVRNPSHTDPGRLAVPAGMAVALAVFIGLRAAWPGLGYAPPVFLATVLGSAVAVWLYQRIEAARAAADAKAREDYRAGREAETRRQIADMKAENP